MKTQKSIKLLIASLFFCSVASNQLYAADRFWDGATPGGDAGGGTGTWATATANWSTASTGGSATTFTTVTDSAVFGGTGGTVTLGVARAAAGVTFTTGGYDLLATSTNILTVGSGGITVTSGAASQVRIGNGVGAGGYVTLSASQVWLNQSNQLFQVRDGVLELGSNTLTLTSTGGGTINIASTTSGTGGNIIVSANTNVSMSGNNSYSGTTTINGTLTVNALKDSNAASGLGTKSSNLASNLVIDGGTLRVQVEAATSDRLFTVGAGGATFEAQITGANSGQILFSGTTAVAYSGVGNRTLTFGGNSDDIGGSSIARVIGDVGGGNGTVALAKNGDHNWTISGVNTFSGGTTISGTGTLTMGNASALGSTSGQLTVNSGTLNMAANNLTVGNLTGSGGIISGTSGTRTLTIGQGNGTGGNFQGAIQNGSGGTTALTKTGNGIITLSGTNTYSGATTVTGGTLAINGTITSAVTVQTGATLQGSGGITGNVTIQGNGTLATGNSIESLSITGNLAHDAASTFAYEINNDAAANVAGDLTTVSGNLSLTSGAFLTLAELGGGSWLVNEKLTLISYAGTWNGGLFTYLGNSLVDDSTFDLSGVAWRFNYNDTTTAGTNYAGELVGTSFVTMTVIPEPRAALLGCLGFLLILRRRR